MFGLMGKLRKQRLWAPDIWLRCFDGQVRPILSYGCEIWGVDALDEMMRGGPPPRRRDRCNLAEGWFEYCLSDPAVKLQIAYMRTVCGAHRPTHRLLFAELSQLPLHFYWASQVCGFWNRIVRQAGALAHDVLREEIALALDGWEDGWSAKVLRFVAALGVNVWEGLPRGETSVTLWAKAGGP